MFYLMLISLLVPAENPVALNRFDSLAQCQKAAIEVNSSPKLKEEKIAQFKPMAVCMQVIPPEYI